MIAVGNAYRICFNGDRFALPGMLGLDILAQLLERPGETIACEELLATAYGAISIVSSSQRMLDRETQHQCLQALGNSTPHERQRILDYLRKSTYRGQGRRHNETPRISVRRAILRTLPRISVVSDTLPLHIAETITTGFQCQYAPAERIAWITAIRKRK
ncbi:MAG TPA: hypothetical protein VMX97_17160 [Hyphomicrobiaceae bacterium]|nr:hypothetical protein [Hyphomicrobiaceae bacterium]